MRQDGRFLLQKNWLPQYSWNIVEIDVEHHNPNLIYQLKIAIGIGGTSYKNNNFKSAPNNLQQIIYMTATIQWNILFYRKMKNNAKRTKKQCKKDKNHTMSFCENIVKFSQTKWVSLLSLILLIKICLHPQHVGLFLLI